MQPTEDFWGGVGQAVGSSPGWMVVAAILVIGMLFIIAKYIWPSRERINMRKLDIREREAQNDSDRIKANAALAEQQQQTNLLIDGMRQSLDESRASLSVLTAEINTSRNSSQRMGSLVEHIDKIAESTEGTVIDTNEKVTILASQTRDIYNMLNRRGEKQDAQ
ncbi:hypothetical protein QUW41_07220 [Slackia piriformis]|nr:hypothetical protein [Slackia piriformis]